MFSNVLYTQLHFLFNIWYAPIAININKQSYLSKFWLHICVFTQAVIIYASYIVAPVDGGFLK